MAIDWKASRIKTKNPRNPHETQFSPQMLMNLNFESGAQEEVPRCYENTMRVCPHTEIFSKFYEIKLKSDCIYHFQIEFEIHLKNTIADFGT